MEQANSCYEFYEEEMENIDQKIKGIKKIKK